MIVNIVDRRKRQYRWKTVNAIIEATSHDNVCEDADEQPKALDDVVYDQREGISAHDAIAWASYEKGAVTLFLYDKGEGI